MNSLFLYAILLLHACTTLAQNLPKEWIMLIDCVHRDQKKLSLTTLNSIKASIPSFNKSLNHLPEERVSPVLKSILYRNLLENPPLSRQNKNPVTQEEVESFFKNYETRYKSQTCTFTNWIIESIQSDFTLLKTTGIASNENLLNSKETTLRQYISSWIELLRSEHNERETLLTSYYADLILATGKVLATFSFYSPEQPTVITYFNWSFDSSFNDQNTIVGPALKAEDKSAAEIIEKNIDSAPTESKTKSEVIDDLIKKKKQNQNIEEEPEL